LIDNIREDTVYGPQDWRTKGFAIGQPIFSTKHFKQNVRVVHRLRDEVARPKGLRVVQLALAWVLRHPAISTALIGVRTRAELQEDIARTATLSEVDLARIDAIMDTAVGRVDVFRPYGRAHEDWSE
jgi:aryl-alcohol dehydrogenase-like predicted oxidoreductase